MEAQYFDTIRIPHERIAVLIGKNGETKRMLEEYTKAQIMVDSKEGEVSIKGEDPLLLYSVKSMITAIARGFNPEITLQLLKTDCLFELLNITDFAPTKNAMIRLKGRIIGKEGKVRRVVEELTDTHVVVYGKTVGIIGNVGNVGLARKAFELLLQGSKHRSVYEWLEKRRRTIVEGQQVREEDLKTEENEQ